MSQTNVNDWKDKLLEWMPCTGSIVALEGSSLDLDESLKAVNEIPFDTFSNVLCFGSHEDEIDESQNYIRDVPTKVLEKIFGFLNHGDMLQCRLVEKSWNYYISTWEKFLDSTVYCLATDPELGLQVFGTNTSYHNAKFSHIDYDVYIRRNDFDELYSENYFFHPSPKFLENIQQLEFKYSYLTWDTLKRILTSTVNLEHLILKQCCVCDEESVPHYNNNPNASFKNVLSGLRKFSIHEALDMNMINRVLNKLLSFSSRSLELLDVQYKPARSDCVVSDEDIMTFCHSLLFVLQVNTPTLKVINFQLDDEIILNRIPPLLAKLEGFWKKLKLKVFELNPSGSVKITQDAAETAKIFTKFFRTQTALTDVALPLIEFPDDEMASNFVDGIISALPPTVMKLSVPSVEYLGKEMIMKKFQGSSIFIGGHSEDYLSASHFLKPSDFRLLRNENNEDSFPTWMNIKELGLNMLGISNITFDRFILMFPKLTTLTIGSEEMRISDNDLQVIISALTRLQSLTINEMDKITDYGITGIPKDVCERITRSENHIFLQNTVFSESLLGNGKPLSYLQGLRHLSLKGVATLSDFGIHFGMRFLELKSIHLPWCEKVTDWGIKKLGENNPSLEKITLCGVNKRSYAGFLQLKKNHPRIKKKSCFFDIFHKTCPNLPTLFDVIPAFVNWA